MRDWIRRVYSESLRGAQTIRHRRWYPGVDGYLQEHRALEFASRDEIEAHQWSRLTALLAHAEKACPFYADRLRRGERGSHAWDRHTFRALPVLTKADLRANAAEMRASGVGAVKRNTSGGSTGMPTTFYQDDRYRSWGAASNRFFLRWWGLDVGERMACLWGRDEPEHQRRSLRDRVSREVEQVRVCNAFRMTESELRDYLRMLTHWQPRVVMGYASALALAARYLASLPGARIRPCVVISSAESLSSADRTVIEAAFGSPVCDFYGSREINNLASECPAHSGLHVNEITRLVEVLDEKGDPCPAGVRGRLVVTDLVNHAMPFIRYDTEDIGSWASGECPCGRRLARLESIAGRRSDFIVTASGRAVHGEAFSHAFYHEPEIRRFQVVQRERGRVLVLVEADSELTPAAVDALERRLGDVAGGELRVELSLVPEIEVPPSGKFRFVRSEVPVTWSSQPGGSA